MRFQPLPYLLAAASLIFACDRPRQNDKERETLLRTDQEWAAVVATGELDKIIAYWADDAIVLPPGAPALIGKPAIRNYVAESLKIPGFGITWEAKQAVVSATGDMGYTIGKNRVSMTGANGAPVVITGNAVTVWRKEPDGAWRCIVDIWNADSAQVAAAAEGGP